MEAFVEISFHKNNSAFVAPFNIACMILYFKVFAKEQQIGLNHTTLAYLQHESVFNQRKAVVFGGIRLLERNAAVFQKHCRGKDYI